jgi:hypothetical protein
VIGGLAVSRLASPAMRQRLVRPFAVLAPLALVPALTAPSAQIVAVLALLSGVAQGGLMPTLQGMFVLALPHGYRARAYGVMQGGMQLTQGGAVLVTGVLADRASIPIVVGLWSVGGTLLMAALAAHWPTGKTFDEAIAAAASSAPPPSEAPQEAAPRRARHEAPEDTRPSAPTRVVVSAPASAHRARPANLEEADEILRQVQPDEPHWRPQPAKPAETRLNGALNGAQSSATPDTAGDTQDLGRRLEPRPFPSRVAAPEGGAMRVTAAAGRPPRTMPGRDNG